MFMFKMILLGKGKQIDAHRHVRESLISDLIFCSHLLLIIGPRVDDLMVQSSNGLSPPHYESGLGMGL